MSLWQNIPFVCILLPLASAALVSVLKGKWCRAAAGLVLLAEAALSVYFTVRMAAYGQSYAYMMGHYPAPWGNEIRAGLLEAVVSAGFSAVALMSFFAALPALKRDVEEGRHSLYMALLMLLTAALQAQVFTNDLFTAYVFVEIMTITAAALIAAGRGGRRLLSSARYMIMNLIGSALFLLGIILLYDLTGHLLMPDIQRAVAGLAERGAYELPLTVVVALLTAGLAVKCGLFPFHTWVPDAYSAATPLSQALLSSLVSKAYIFLICKIFCRVIGPRVIAMTGVDNMLLLFGAAGMVLGSVIAVRQEDAGRMVAYSSVAQIGYICAGIALGTQAGMTAAVFHMLSHAAAKSLLFLSLRGLRDVSGSTKRSRLVGAARRHPLMGLAFTLGALSMVGLPLTGGLPAKLNLGLAAAAVGGWRMWALFAALILSAALNAVYFLGTLVELWRPSAEGAAPLKVREALPIGALMALNIAAALFASPLTRAIRLGLSQFG